MKKVLIGKGLIEIVVILIVLVLIACLILPTSIVISRAKVSKTTCISNLRQIAMASLMFVQDNNEIMPGLIDKKSKKKIGWVKNVIPYFKSGYDVATPLELFNCPEINNKGDVYPISYAYNAALIESNSMGIDIGMINYPEKIGIACDAEPTPNEGGIIGTITGQSSKFSVKPVGRHSGDVIVGYADGHSAFVSVKYDENDKENGVNKAFYRAVELGYIKKPAGGR